MPLVELELRRHLLYQVIMRLPSRSLRWLSITEVASLSSWSARPRVSHSTRGATTAAMCTCTGDEITIILWRRGFALQHAARCFVFFDDSMTSQQRVRVSSCYVVPGTSLPGAQRAWLVFICFAELIGQGLLRVPRRFSTTEQQLGVGFCTYRPQKRVDNNQRKK